MCLYGIVCIINCVRFIPAKVNLHVFVRTKVKVKLARGLLNVREILL